MKTLATVISRLNFGKSTVFAPVGKGYKNLGNRW